MLRSSGSDAQGHGERLILEVLLSQLEVGDPDRRQRVLAWGGYAHGKDYEPAWILVRFKECRIHRVRDVVAAGSLRQISDLGNHAVSDLLIAVSRYRL